MKVSNLIEGIRSKAYLLPEFQREYVWSKEQAKQLIVSMFKEYPTGCILLWETTNPPDVKNSKIMSDGRMFNLILDGQQRLTTLYMFITGSIPPYYTENDITDSPLDLHINLYTGDFQYYQKQLMANLPVWQKVVDCLMTNDISPFSILAKYKKLELPIENDMEFCETINDNLTQLRKIKDLDYKELIVPNSAKIDDAIDVFDRVNSLGTKLTDAELALTHITGKWPTARKEMKKAIDFHKKNNMQLSLDFMTRCVVICLTKSALFESLDYAKYEKDDYINAWKQVKKVCEYLLPILRNLAKIHDTDDLSTTNLLIPMVAYLLANNVFDEKTKNGFIYWMFMAMIWQRYSGQTNQRLDKDVQICIKESKPIKDLVNEIIEMRGRIEVKASDLEGKGAAHPLYRMFYIMTKSLNAVDFANGSYIGDTIGDYYSIQSHHLFPKALLQKNGYDLNNTIHSKLVNEIANRAFITRDTNYSLKDRSPADYLEEISVIYPSVFADHFIPLNKGFWQVENYLQFLAKRREMIAEGINSFIEGFQDKYEGNNISNGFKSYLDRIKSGEDSFTEFKSTMLFSLSTQKAEKYIEFACAKTICAFLNSEGGRLFIGVDDSGQIIGLDNDFSLFNKDNKYDEFRLRYDNIIKGYIGAENSVYISTELLKIDDKDVFVVNVSASNSPVFIKSNDQGKEEFYIRQAASSQPLSMSQTNEYINNRFNN